MNKSILIGRLTRDAEVRYGGANNSAVARFSLAVPRKFKQDGQPDCDFINFVAFGKNAESAEKYFTKGVKVCIVGHIQTGSYTNKDGQKVYTTDVIVDEWEFAESKNASQANAQNTQGQLPPMPSTDDSFMQIPDGIDEQLPFV